MTNLRENLATIISVALARSKGGYNNPAITNWTTEQNSLVKVLSKPVVGSKDGSYFIRCTGTKRNNQNTAYTASVLILDGDSRIDEDGIIKSGAPHPQAVHDALTSLVVGHIICSSHSNGMTEEEVLRDKGDIDTGGQYGDNFHKYRVVIPCTYQREELPALLDHLFNILHKAGVMLAPVKENRTWSQPWFFPRVPDKKRLEAFKFQHHDGETLDVDSIVGAWQPPGELIQTIQTDFNKEGYKSVAFDYSGGRRNPIKEFNQSYSCRDVLLRNGYKDVEKGRMIRPGSSSKIAGIATLTNCIDGKERIYSFGGDVLNDEKPHDAFDCYRLLECGGDEKKALNWSPEITKHNQRIHAQEKKPASKNNKIDVNVEKNGVTGVTGVTDTKINDLDGYTIENEGVTGVTDDSPSTEKRPCYVCHADYWIDHNKRAKKAGVWYHAMTKETKNAPAQKIDNWVCGEVQVLAVARDKAARSFGQVLHFKNKLGHWQTWNMPTRLLAGRGDDLLKELLDMGLAFNYQKRGQIPAYISSVNPKKAIWTASQVGWFDNYDSFVLPDCTIGKEADGVLFQSESNTHHEYSHTGSLIAWRESISMLCTGNPILIFTVSCAFAGALLKVCNIDGIGFHYFGDSSRGKTTGLKLAASVWGHWEKYKRSWKATANGLEGAANLFNDGLITLDEIGDGEAKEISDALYMFGNRTGKQRANVLGQAKAVKTWRIAALSNGEKTIEAHLAQKGLTMKAGQLIRFLQVPLFGQYGAFDDLHGFKDGREFADAILKDADKVYGVAGREWLDRLTQDTDTLKGCPQYLDDAVKGFITQFGELTPQEARAAKAFALVGIAGELATDYGITGWNKNESINAALVNFKHWRQYRGIGETEPQQIKDAVRDYIESFGDARFTCTLDDTRLHGERSGYWRETDKGRQWLFSGAGLKQAVKGYDIKQVESILKQEGWLIPDAKGKTKQVSKVKDCPSGQGRFYVIQVQDNHDTEASSYTGYTFENEGVTTQDTDFKDGYTSYTQKTDNATQNNGVERF